VQARSAARQPPRATLIGGWNQTGRLAPDEEATLGRINLIHAVVAGSVALALAPAALAGGEPKNEWPFTRPVQEGATIVLRDENGFAWFDAALGAAAGLGVGLVMIGAVTLRAPRRQEPRPAL
jgi:hypothetical protein